MAGRQSCSPDILRCTASTAQWVRVHPKIGGSPTIKVQWSRIIAIIGHSSPLTSNICFNSLQPHPPSNHSILLSAFIWRRSQSWNDNWLVKNNWRSWVPPKNLSEHLLEEVNWLFCRRLSALSFPPAPLLTRDPIHPGECCKFLLRPFTRQSNHC